MVEQFFSNTKKTPVFFPDKVRAGRGAGLGLESVPKASGSVSGNFLEVSLFITLEPHGPNQIPPISILILDSNS